MIKIVIVLCTLAGLSLGQPEKSGPYPAKGWKPQGAHLELPSQYGPPRGQSTAPDGNDISSVNEYLPPTSTEKQSDEDDILRVQGLPAADAVSQFRNYQSRPSSNTKVQQSVARIQIAPAPAFVAQPFLLSPLFAPQFAPNSGRLQEMQFGQVKDFDNPKSDAQQLPAQAYGPPKPDASVPPTRQPLPELPQNEVPEQEQSDKEDEGEEEDQDESDAPAVAVSNAESTGSLVQVAQRGQAGQYYILLPGNSLQKVRFATKQTEEDREINGFSAQLR